MAGWRDNDEGVRGDRRDKYCPPLRGPTSAVDGLKEDGCANIYPNPGDPRSLSHFPSSLIQKMFAVRSLMVSRISTESCLLIGLSLPPE